MAENIYRRFGLDGVINASGKMTALGGSAQSDAVARAQADAAQSHVDLEAVAASRRRTDRALRRAPKRHRSHRAPRPASRSRVAACITGTHLDRVLRVPDTEDFDRGCCFRRDTTSTSARRWRR